MAGGWFKTYAPGSPVRLIANVEENNRIRNILNDIQGIGCRIEKPRGANGLGWRIIVGSGTDVDPIPDSAVGGDTGQIPYKPYDLDARYSPAPSGIIVLWSGSIASIPGGWALCDGTNGTPNLKSRFVIGAGDTAYPVAGSGGTSTHAHSLVGHFGWGSLPHAHILTTSPTPNAAAGSDLYCPTSNITSAMCDTDGTPLDTGASSSVVITQDTAGPMSHIPPYYALAYIMKL